MPSPDRQEKHHLPPGETCTATAQVIQNILHIAGTFGYRLHAQDVRAESLALDERIPIRVVHSHWARIMVALRLPALPIRAAQVPPLSTRNLLRFLCGSASTFGRALDYLQEFWPLTTDWFHWNKVITPDRVKLIVVGAPALTLGERCAIEYWTASLVWSGRLLTGQSFSPLKVQFAHHAPAGEGSCAEHERFFAAPLSFSAPTTEVHLPRGLLELRMAQSNPGLEALLLQHARRQLAAISAQQTFTGRVRAALQTGCCDSSVTLATVARRCGIGARTLQRRLEAEGSSFGTLLDAARQQRAEADLGSFTDEVLAERLGYSDARAFRRAFQRWTGQTPQMWRRERKTNHRNDTE